MVRAIDTPSFCNFVANDLGEGRGEGAGGAIASRNMPERMPPFSPLLANVYNQVIQRRAPSGASRVAVAPPKTITFNNV